jgi:DNA (cytosine-5)-methyltransferase 1
LDSNLTAVSLFAGIGGFDLALSNAGVKVCASVEIDNKCRDVLSKHFPKTKLFSDVKDVTGDQLRAAGFIPERGIITAGFPCQDLSVAGLRKGLAGSRSGLFWEIIRLVDETQPRYLIIENVAGLLSSQSGRDLGIVIEALVERRYGIAWRVLDSQYFGVPQRRRRVFIVACLTDHRSPVKILFEPESRTGHLEPSTKKKQKITRLPASGTDIHTWTKSRRASSDTDWETWVESDITPTLNQFDVADTRTTTIVTKSPELFDATRNADVRFYDQSPTMKARWGTGGNNVPMTEFKGSVRRLTPTECERLQAFPDDWTTGQSDSARYKQLGNAVTVSVVAWIVNRVVSINSKRVTEAL